MTGDRLESETALPEPDSMLDRLDALCGAAKRVATQGPFELYHRVSITVRVVRNLPGGPDDGPTLNSELREDCGDHAPQPFTLLVRASPLQPLSS